MNIKNIVEFGFRLVRVAIHTANIHSTSKSPPAGAAMRTNMMVCKNVSYAAHFPTDVYTTGRFFVFF